MCSCKENFHKLSKARELRKAQQGNTNIATRLFARAPSRYSVTAILISFGPCSKPLGDPVAVTKLLKQNISDMESMAFSSGKRCALPFAQRGFRKPFARASGADRFDQSSQPHSADARTWVHLQSSLSFARLEAAVFVRVKPSIGRAHLISGRASGLRVFSGPRPETVGCPPEFI